MRQISWNGEKPNLPPPVKFRGQVKLLVDQAQSDQMRQISTIVEVSQPLVETAA